MLLLSVARKTFTPGGYGSGPNAYAMHDTGAASATLSLQAAALRLHTHEMGGFDREKARAAFGIPEEFEMGACWAIGYLGEAESLPDALRARELAVRNRKGLGEFVFSEWEVAADFRVFWLHQVLHWLRRVG